MWDIFSTIFSIFFSPIAAIPAIMYPTQNAWTKRKQHTCLMMLILSVALLLVGIGVAMFIGLNTISIASLVIGGILSLLNGMIAESIESAYKQESAMAKEINPYE